MTRVRVFTGPTLDHDTAAGLVEAEMRPPVTVDDLPEALDDGVDIACIIDGAFVQRYSATPTQIVACLRAGMALYGAASAGALRAVEAAPFGMRGVGTIYGLFARGFVAEDELLMSYDPLTLRPLSVPMVNVRHATRQAVEAGVLTPAERSALNVAAKAQYFAHRSWRSITIAAEPLLGDGRAARFLEWVDEQGDGLDLKRADAIACLREVRTHVDALNGVVR